jgi:hypothetical protein
VRVQLVSPWQHQLNTHFLGRASADRHIPAYPVCPAAGEDPIRPGPPEDAPLMGLDVTLATL